MSGEKKAAMAFGRNLVHCDCAACRSARQAAQPKLKRIVRTVNTGFQTIDAGAGAPYIDLHFQIGDSVAPEIELEVESDMIQANNGSLHKVYWGNMPLIGNQN